MASFALPSPEELELPLLSVFYRAKKQGRDRRGDSMVSVDRGTGLPTEQSDLVGRSRAIGGERLAFSLRVEAEIWSTAFLALTHKPKADWTDEESDLRDDLVFRIKRSVTAMAGRGLFELHPKDLFTGEPMGTSVDGMFVQAQITPMGLREAEDRCVGTKYESGPVSILWGAPEEIWNAAPDYAKKMAKQEGQL